MEIDIRQRFLAAGVPLIYIGKLQHEHSLKSVFSSGSFVGELFLRRTTRSAGGKKMRHMASPGASCTNVCTFRLSLPTSLFLVTPRILYIVPAPPVLMNMDVRMPRMPWRPESGRTKILLFSQVIYS